MIVNWAVNIIQALGLLKEHSEKDLENVRFYRIISIVLLPVLL